MKRLLLLLTLSALPVLAAITTGNIGTLIVQSEAGGGQDFSDDFNRADSSNLGASWTEQTGDWSIVSNQLKLADEDSNNVLIYDATALSTTTGYAYIEATAGGNYPSLIFRYSNASSPYYHVQFDHNLGEVYWVRWASVGGATTDLETLNDLHTGDDNAFGITWTGTGDSTIVRVWVWQITPPSTVVPTDVDTWDGIGPTGTFTANPSSPVNAGAYTGIGLYQSDPSTVTIDKFAGGDATP